MIEFIKIQKKKIIKNRKVWAKNLIYYSNDKTWLSKGTAKKHFTFFGIIIRMNKIMEKLTASERSTSDKSQAERTSPFRFADLIRSSITAKRSSLISSFLIRNTISSNFISTSGTSIVDHKPESWNKNIKKKLKRQRLTLYQNMKFCKTHSKKTHFAFSV